MASETKAAVCEDEHPYFYKLTDEELAKWVRTGIAGSRLEDATIALCEMGRCIARLRSALAAAQQLGEAERAVVEASCAIMTAYPVVITDRGALFDLSEAWQAKVSSLLALRSAERKTDAG